MSFSYVPFTLTLAAESTIYQNEVRCHVNENDFNYSLNPTMYNSASFTTGSYLISGSQGPFYTPVGFTGSYNYLFSGKINDNVSSSSFTPYATTVGLYNEMGDLLVVGKLATPYPIPSNTDMTFIIRWDS